MSVPKRKVYRYVVKVIDNRTDKVLSPDVIRECFEIVLKRPKLERKIEDVATNRIYYLDEIRIRADYGLGYFISAKHHHRPPLIHTDNLSQRDNPKEPEEGEMEKTHFAIGFAPEEVYLLMEKKQGGVSIGRLTSHLNDVLRSLKGRGQRIQYELLVSGSFLKKLREMPKVLCAEIYTETALLSDTFLKDVTMEREIRENIELVMRAKRGQSIRKTVLEWLYKKVSQESAMARINRMKIIGKSEDNDTLLLDTDHLTESEYIEVEIDDNGQVVTESILPKLRHMMRNMLGNER